jgi:hypothetical protein
MRIVFPFAFGEKLERGRKPSFQYWRREKSPPPTPPKKNFCRFGETAEILRYAQDDQNTVGWEGGFYPFPYYVTMRSASDEGSPLLMEEVN